MDYIQQRLREIGDQVLEDAGTHGTYVFEDWTEATLQLNRITSKKGLPAILSIMPPRGDFDFKENGTLTDSENCQLLFLSKEIIDPNAKSTEPIVFRMKALAVSMLGKIKASSDLDFISGVTYQVVIDDTDAGLTGVSVTLDIKNLNPQCYGTD